MHIEDKFNRIDSNKKELSVQQIKIKKIYDEHPDWSYLEQEGFEDRLKEFQNDNLYFIGIRAETNLYIPKGNNTCQIMKINSGGLWSIEFDTPEEDLQDIIQHELSDILDTLSMFGINTNNIPVIYCEDIVSN